MTKDKAIEINLDRLERDMMQVEKVKKRNMDMVDAEKKKSEQEKMRANKERK